jgi:hypothetical protein
VCDWRRGESGMRLLPLSGFIASYRALKGS